MKFIKLQAKSPNYFPDKVKFRKPVVPGDQLIIEATLDKIRGNKLATAKVECKVGEQVVSSASLMFSVVDAGDDA